MVFSRPSIILLSALLSTSSFAQTDQLLTPQTHNLINQVATQFNTINSETILEKLTNSSESTLQLIAIEKAIDKEFNNLITAGLSTAEAIRDIENYAEEQTIILPKDIRENLLNFVSDILNRKKQRNKLLLDDTSPNLFYESLFGQLEKMREQSKNEWLEVINDKAKSLNKLKYPSHPRRILQRDITISKSESFSASVKASIFGVEISAGPKLSFERRFVINAKLLAPGHEPIVVQSASLGVGVLNHSTDRRIVYLCTVTAQAVHKLTGTAGLTVFGTGASIERGRWESLSVQQTSELKEVPFAHANGRRYNLADIENECKNSFYKRVKASMSKELKLAASELVYRNSQNECATDYQCYDWHRSLLGIIRMASVPRCDTTIVNGNPINICKVRGRKGNACAVVDKNGKRLSAGFFEYPCDNGLKCTVVSEGGWFTNGKIYDVWRAQCL